MKRLLTFFCIFFIFGFLINFKLNAQENLDEIMSKAKKTSRWKDDTPEAELRSHKYHCITKDYRKVQRFKGCGYDINARTFLDIKMVSEIIYYKYKEDPELFWKNVIPLREELTQNYLKVKKVEDKEKKEKQIEYKAMICKGDSWSNNQNFYNPIYIFNAKGACEGMNFITISPNLYFDIKTNPEKYYDSENTHIKYLSNSICLIKKTKKIHNLSQKCNDEEINLYISGYNKSHLFLNYDKTAENKIIAEANKNKEEEEKRIADAKKKKEDEEKKIADAKKKKEEEEKRIADAKKKKEEEEKNKKQNQEELFVIGSGSGFFVSSNGYAVSNDHVVGICRKVASKIKGKIIYFDIISTDQKNDLGLLKSDYRNKEFLNIKISGAEFGEDIVAFGFPLSDALSSSIKLTRGIVSALSGPENNFSEIQIDAAIQPGNSGGPVINMQGQVVGVASSGLNKLYMLEKTEYIPENVNFAVAAPTLTNFLRANGVSVSNRSLRVKNTKDLAKIGRPSTLQLFCMNTKAAYEKLKKQQKHSDVLLEKVVELK